MINKSNPKDTSDNGVKGSGEIRNIFKIKGSAKGSKSLN